MPPRPDWDQYFLGVAAAVAVRADCTRRKVGCVIVDTDRRIIATGYNGSEPGGPSCLAGQCPRGRHYRTDGGDGSCMVDWHRHHLPDGVSPPLDTCRFNDMCACGKAWPCSDAVAPGSSYDSGAGTCISTHAEANALLFARASVKGATLYCTEHPCNGCQRLINSAGISRIVVGR